MSFINRFRVMYSRLPSWLVNMMAPFYYCIPSALRYGKVFQKTSAILSKQEMLKPDEVEALKNNEFLALIKHAYANVPYYRKTFDEHGISPTDIKDLRDISRLPFMNKEIMAANREQLIAQNINRNNLQYIATSGSTGNPIGFYVDSDSAMKEWAYTLNLWKRVGYRPDSSRLVLRGKVFWSQRTQGRSWQYDAFKRELSCDIFNLSEKNMEQYCLAIERYKPEFVHGYMSAILLMCKYIECRIGGLRHVFKAVLAVSETVLDDQREYVERTLGTRVFSFYGHSERLVIAGECEYSKEYHIEPLYGFAEIIDGRGVPIADGAMGELVATGFCNKGMPLIRYKTGDIASWSPNATCRCGRSHARLAGVMGRWKQDVLIGKNGVVISLTALNMHTEVYDRLVKYQFFQEDPGIVTMKIVPRHNFSNSDRDRIIAELREKTGDSISYSIALLADIPLKKNGKYQIVDQRLKTDLYSRST